MFISHSISSQYALLTSDACPDLVLAHVPVEGDQATFSSYENATNGANTSILDRPYNTANIDFKYFLLVINAI